MNFSPFFFALTLAAGTSFSTAVASDQPVAQKQTPVLAVAVLKTSLTSRNQPEGKEVKAQLKQSVALPDGTELPKGTLLLGKVAGASAHSRQKPNGAVMLLFDQAKLKGGKVVPVSVKIQTLAPSESGPNYAQLPGNKLGGTTNAGGMQQQVYDLQNGNRIWTPNVAQSSSIAGISLGPVAGGSGVAYSMGQDVYLDDGIQLGLVMTNPPAKQ